MQVHLENTLAANRITAKLSRSDSSETLLDPLQDVSNLHRTNSGNFGQFHFHSADERMRK